MSNRTPQTGRPTNYGNEKLSMLRARSGLLKPLLERFVPIAFPGSDRDGMVYALMGFTSFSTGWRENTTDADRTQAFHEVGLFQVPAGDRSGPAPNSTGGDDAYIDLARGALVNAMLTHSASTEANAWRPSERNDASAHDVRAREEQVAVGLANLVKDEASIRTKMEREAPGSAGSTSGWSIWRIFTMFTAMSRGPSGAFARLQPYLHRLVEVHENVRLHALLEMVDRDILAGLAYAKTTWKGGVCYALARSLQKLMAGLKLADAEHGPSAFFADARPISPEAEVRLATIAYTQRASDLVIDTAVAAGSLAINAVGAITGGDPTIRGAVMVVVLLAAFTGLMVAAGSSA